MGRGGQGGRGGPCTGARGRGKRDSVRGGARRPMRGGVDVQTAVADAEGKIAGEVGAVRGGSSGR